MTWHQYFKDITKLTASKSTCLRLQVGAVLVRENRIVSIGYNGVPHGEKHCNVYFKELYDAGKTEEKYGNFYEYLNSKEFYRTHGEFSLQNELHGETNCIGWAAKSGVSTNGCELYVTDSPCTNCAKLILTSGIKAVYYNKKYDRDQNGIELLIRNKIICNEIDFEIKE